MASVTADDLYSFIRDSAEEMDGQIVSHTPRRGDQTAGTPHTLRTSSKWFDLT